MKNVLILNFTLIKLLKLFANAQLYDDVTKKAAYLQLLYEAGNAITGTLSLDKILDQIAEQAWKVTGYDGEQARFCNIDFVEDTQLRFKTAYPPEQQY